MRTSSLNRSTRRRLTVAGVLAVAAVGGIVTVPLIAGAQPAGHLGSKTTLQRVKVGKYGEVLADAAVSPLYVLSAGSKGTRHCTSRVPRWLAAGARRQEHHDHCRCGRQG